MVPVCSKTIALQVLWVTAAMQSFKLLKWKWYQGGSACNIEINSRFLVASAIDSIANTNAKSKLGATRNCVNLGMRNNEVLLIDMQKCTIRQVFSLSSQNLGKTTANK